MRITKDKGYYNIIFPYTSSLVDKVKKLPERKWNYIDKIWQVPVKHEGKVKEFAEENSFKMDSSKVTTKMERFVIPPLPELKVDIPLKLQPYSYQKTGIAYSIEKKKLIMGDDMGLGKTAQSIATVSHLDAFPCLVICPASLKLNWQREWHMWTDKKALLLTNQNKDTWTLFTKAENNLFGTGALANVFITNYESLKKYFVKDIIKPSGREFRIIDIKFNENINLFKSVIIDESHRVKEPKTLQSKLTKGVCSGKEVILALTGTPVVNKPRDLASQLAIIDQLNSFGGYKRFVDRYCEGWNGADNLNELNFLLNKHCYYRREKSEVLKDLPPKVRQIVPCDITTKKEYREALADLEVYLKKYKQATDDQIARSMKGEVMVRIGILKNISARGKLNDVVDYVKDIIEAGEKIIIFVHLKEVAAHIKSIFPSSLTILGSDSNKTRQANVDKFQEDPEAQIIICSIKAAGVGITLTASSRVAFVELPWHPADTDQCEDRAYRIGQVNSVHCTYFLGENTIDHWIYQVINEKREISSAITGAKNDVETSVINNVIDLLSNSLKIK